MSTSTHRAGWVGEWSLHTYGNKTLRRWRASGPWRDSEEEAMHDRQLGEHGGAPMQSNTDIQKEKTP